MKLIPMHPSSGVLRTLFLPLVLAILAVSSTWGHAATTWWVYQATGSDTTGTGTSSLPFATISHAVTKAASGDTIEVKNGTYREMVVMKSGLSLIAAPSNHPIVTGLGNLAAPTQIWSTYSGTTDAPSGSNLYTTTAPWVARDLYSSYTRQQIARFPASYSPWATISTYNATTSTLTLTAPLGITFSNVMSSFVYIFQSHGSAALDAYLTYYITSIDSTGTNITIKLPPGDVDASHISAGDILIVCNHPQLIRGSGDWAYEDNGNGTTTIVWDEGGVGNIDFAQASQLSYGIKVENVSDILIQGMEVTGAEADGIYCLKDSNVTIQKCAVHDNGFGGPFGGDGVIFDTCTSPVLENSIVGVNFNGLGTASGTGLNINECEIAFNDADGADLAGRGASEPLSSPVIQNCYLHNNMSQLHPDNLQLYSTVQDITIQNNYFAVSGQSLMTQDTDGVTLKNNVITSAVARNCIIGHGTSSNWMLNNNTFAFGDYGAISADPVDGVLPDIGTFSILDCVFYRDILSYTGETSSDYNLFYNRNGSNPDDPVGVTAPPWNGTAWTAYYTNPTGTQKGLNALLTYNVNWEPHSDVPTGNPAFNNAPLDQATVQSGLLQSTTTQLVLDVQGSMHLTGYFNVNDVIEVDGDGVPRTISAVASVSAAHTTITFTPALTARPFRDMVVWDWPAGTTNLVCDYTPSSGSPALSGSSTGGQRGSTVNTVQYAAGSFDGTGVRSIPALPSGMAHAYEYNGYALYPYQGPNP
jgi:hypothetical protein